MTMATGNLHAEGGGERLSSGRTPAEGGFHLTVRQPEKITSLLTVLGDLERISERIGEEHSQDLGGGAAGPGRGDGAAKGAQVSLRQQAIRSLPPLEVMQQQIIHHLQREVRSLERSARRTAWRVRKGTAYLLTQIYARVRKIQALIAELREATAEMIQRLYIRLFIDHQQLV